MKFYFGILLALGSVLVAQADDTCNIPGYYLNENDECVACLNNHYCTGDGTMQPCPEFTYSSTEELKALVTGYNVHSVYSAVLATEWHYNRSQLDSINKCTLVLAFVEVDQGRIYRYVLRYSPQSGTYSNDPYVYWDRANNGYYLSNVHSSGDMWRSIKSCTNSHPANSHYSGPGTPDSSTVTDANDCPWVCDDGYYGSSAAGSNSCTLCEAGNFCTGGVKTACSAGYYSSTTGATSCTACTTDPTTGRPTYSTTAGATSCTVCPAATVYANRVTRYYWASDVAVHNVAWGCRAWITEQDPTGNYGLSCHLVNGDYGVVGSCGSGTCCMAGNVTSCAAGYYAPYSDPNANIKWAPTVADMVGQVCVPVGTGYYSADGALTRTACSAGLYTVGYGHGADEENDCGHILHVGDYKLYMRKNKLTTPSINIKMANGNIYYISLSPTNHNISRLHFQYDNNQYTAYDDSLYYNERNFDE